MKALQNCWKLWLVVSLVAYFWALIAILYIMLSS
jgi:hypothetical protein